MEGSILIYGSNRNTREKKVLEYTNPLIRRKLDSLDTNNPDVLTVEKGNQKNNIGIDQVRDIIKFLSERPYQEGHKVVVILRAECLTIPAQNALLKTLEEPPPYALIILEAKSENSLLETVISRCQKVYVKPEERSESDSGCLEVRTMDMGNRLVWAEETSKLEKQDIVDMLEEWIQDLERNVAENKDAISIILDVSRDLEQTNINTRLALEYMVLNI